MMTKIRKIEFLDQICLFGAGGFAKEVLCCLLDQTPSLGSERASKIRFVVKDEEFKSGSEIMGVPLMPQSEFDSAKHSAILTIGDPQLRKLIAGKLPSNTHYTSAIHPTAVISEWVMLGKGAVITAGCILTCDIQLGDHAQLNLLSTIGHDCRLGHYFTTAPAANISGECNFGNCVYFGTNSSVRQGVRICDEVTIGMGGVVVKNIEVPGVYIGNPLKKLER